MSVKLILKLRPEFWNVPPFIQLEINGEIHPTDDFKISNRVVEYSFQIDDQKNHLIKIKRFGKQPSDTLFEDNKVTKDQLLYIEDIVVDDVSLKRFLHLGNFYPDYPEPWASEQRSNGVELPEVENYRSTLYHNGTCEFDF